MYRFNSHLSIALPDPAEASASHQSVAPLQQPPEQWHAWNLHIYSQIPSTIDLPEAGLLNPHRLTTDQDG